MEVKGNTPNGNPSDPGKNPGGSNADNKPAGKPNNRPAHPLNSKPGSKPTGTMKPSGGVANSLKKFAAGIGQFVTSDTGRALITSLMSLLKNHPEWYTHYNTSNLIALNLASKQNEIYEATRASYSNGVTNFTYTKGMPSIALMHIMFTVPKEDMDGWKSGVRLVYQALRTANSGRINYLAKDVEKYIVNVRMLHAINAYLQKIYRLTYTFASTNNAVPLVMLEAAGVDAEDIMANANNLFAFCQRYAQQCNVAFPLNMPLFERAEWIMRATFLDSESEKPSFYVTGLTARNDGDLVPNDGQTYYVCTDASNPAAIAWEMRSLNIPIKQKTTYAELKAYADRIKNDLLNDYAMGMIAGDIIKAFGDKAFGNWDITKIDESAPVIFDKYLLNQVQNATVMFAGQTMRGSNLTGYESTTAYHSQQLAPDGFIIDNMGCGDSIIFPGNDNEPGNRVRDIMDKASERRLVNWHASKIQPGEIMSITRLCVHTVANPQTPNLSYAFTGLAYGTEVITDVIAIVPASDAYDSYTNSGYMYEEIAGLLLHSTTNDSASINDDAVAASQTAFLWANFDYAPRFRYASRTSTTIEGYVNGVSEEVLDWDVFALLHHDILENYFSYGNQSLLYCGNSQNQSNTRVYKRSATRNGGRTNNNRKPQEDGGANNRHEV